MAILSLASRGGVAHTVRVQQAASTGFNLTGGERMADMAVSVEDKSTGFIRGLGLLDSTMIVAGSMIGSGIFIVSAEMARQVGSPGWLLVAWVITGLLTVMAALSYGELAA